MQRAIDLSIESVEKNTGGPFGTVIVHQGKIIAEGQNQVTATCDPTAHAEVIAIRKACQHLQKFHLDDVELYTSCEPCPMCLAAIYWAHIPVIYYAGLPEDAASVGFDDSKLYNEIQLPKDQRELQMRPMLREQAQKAFELWSQSADKTEY